jgi:murein DD-endopeptidase MepM/ murein hydrolase activator NlpD
MLPDNPNGYTITSGFDALRDNGARVHSGIDISMPVGTPITVPELPGAIIHQGIAGWSKKGGYNEKITGIMPSGARFEMQFNHLQKEGRYTKKGQISPGSILGYSGNTGTLSSGPHLDFKIKVNGKYVRPEEAYEKLLVPPTHVKTTPTQSKHDKTKQETPKQTAPKQEPPEQKKPEKVDEIEQKASEPKAPEQPAPAPKPPEQKAPPVKKQPPKKPKHERARTKPKGD